MMQKHERVIHDHVQQLQKTSFKHIQKNWWDIRSKLQDIQVFILIFCIFYLNKEELIKQVCLNK